MYSNSNHSFTASIIKLKYETLEAQYPLGQFAQQALVEQAYAYHKFGEPDTAIDTINRFARIYPRSSLMDYALYLRGIINFSRGSGLVERIFPRDLSERDSVRQKEAFTDFSTLIERFPNSRYTPDAQQRVHFLKNILGQSEIKIANYYMERGAYLAAFNRADYTIKHHQGSPAIISALQIKNCAAKKLGKDDLANDAMRIIQLNFPDQASFSCS